MDKIFLQELKAMSSQIAILKEKLNKQTIINEVHIRNSMKSTRSEMTKTIAYTIFIGALSLPYSTWIFYKYGFSLFFIIASGIMLTVCLGLTIKQRYTLKNLDFTQGNLIEVAEKVNRVKTHYSEWIKIALPMILSWVGWLAYEVLTKMEPGHLQMGFLAGIVVGVLFGGIVGYRINRKIVGKSTDILSQISELQDIK